MDLGNFDECVQIRDIETPEGDMFSGKLCLVTVMNAASGRGTSFNKLEKGVSEKNYTAEMMVRVAKLGGDDVKQMASNSSLKWQ